MGKVSILIVEDEAIIAADLANKAKEMDFKVLGLAHTVEDAIEIVNRSCPQLVLVDIHLKGPTNGIEAAKFIQELCDNLPVIFISGDSDTEAIKGAELTGPHGFIAKPFEKQALVSQVEKVLKNKVSWS